MRAALALAMLFAGIILMAYINADDFHIQTKEEAYRDLQENK